MSEEPARLCSNCGSRLPPAAPGTVDRCKFCGTEFREEPPLAPFDPAAVNPSPTPTLAIVAGVVGVAVVALVVVAVVATRGSSASSGPPARTQFHVTVDGQSLDVVPTAAGWDVDQGGSRKDRVKVEGDRVKVEDSSGQLVAEAKREDYGFKVYDAQHQEVLKGKRHGAGWKLERADGTEVAKLATSSDDAIGAVPALTAEQRIAVVVLLHEGPQ